MGLNKQKGNMYPFVTHTWNPIRGKCPHDCVYCYMKVYPQPELHFAEKEMETNLGQGNFIFVGSSTDMWAENVPGDWIAQVLQHCRKFNNQYLFQTKNPARFVVWRADLFPFPSQSILGTTIETNRDYSFSKAPTPIERFEAMNRLFYPEMVSIEPIMDFDFDIIFQWISGLHLKFVSIGADSKGHNLPEPPPEKVKALVESLQEITTVKIKDNLTRLLTPT